MKKTVMLTTLTILLLLLIPPALALRGGDTWTHHIDKCEWVNISVSATQIIDLGEYTVLNNCTNTATNRYSCDCFDNYDVQIRFDIRAVNNYTIKITTPVDELPERIIYFSSGRRIKIIERIVNVTNTTKHNETITQPVICEECGTTIMPEPEDNLTYNDSGDWIVNTSDYGQDAIKEEFKWAPIIISLLIGVITYLLYQTIKMYWKAKKDYK